MQQEPRPQPKALKPRPRARLLLAGGLCLEGYAVGAEGDTLGEICFNTGMSGYQEIFSDPSYYGQIIVMTHSHIGNYGVHAADFESGGFKIAGLVCRNFSEQFSRPDAEASLRESFRNQGVVGIEGVDTRRLVRHIRQQGAMNALITTSAAPLEELQAKLGAWPSMEGLNLVPEVSTPQPYTLGEAQAARHIAVLDLGVKQEILNQLVRYGCRLTVFPHNTPREELLACPADAYFISNGPGDPAAMEEQVALVRQLTEADRPVFGICLGHQLIARAAGLETFKMRFGHRGINHPVKNLLTGKSEITSQNHGFAVQSPAPDSLPGAVEITHLHLNDHTVAGLRLRQRPVFSVQYHPEAHPGPHDGRYLFQQFIELIDTHRQAPAHA